MNAVCRLARSSHTYATKRDIPRRVLFIFIGVLSFSFYYFLTSRKEMCDIMGSDSLWNAFLYSLNMSAGLGGYWQPVSMHLRTVGVLQFLLMLLLVL